MSKKQSDKLIKMLKSVLTDKEFLKEIDDIENCEAAKWQRYYIIAHDNRLFLMDTSQKSFSRGEPYSTFQYECYLWTGINARILWEDDEKNQGIGGKVGSSAE